MNDDRPTPAQLRQWRAQWLAIKKEAYRRLVASYTDDQKATVAIVNRANRQAVLCRERLARREPRDDWRRLAWPQEPPPSTPAAAGHRNEEGPLAVGLATLYGMIAAYEGEGLAAGALALRELAAACGHEVDDVGVFERVAELGGPEQQTQGEGRAA